ncbi:phage tail tube assembly chaperone [Lacticaseibacillus daqingensis]|uniref:phage tail tube assembly chaperone n=1 Tax=Lacticaseibacillus daqingensis TaxID=2486014 RepID=UPI000F7863A4|nr:phage tail tube assembly chaperone [Lacticaseibacillus daqingensis]
MKLQIKQLGTKHYEVKTSNRNMRAMFALQLTMAKAGDIDGLDPEEQVQRSYEMLNQVLDFIQGALNLSDKDAAKLDDLEFDQTVEIANYVIARMMGMSDEDIDLAQKSDQKSQD